MAAGADKGFAFDPPGAIGLVPDDAIVLLKSHDRDATVPVRDDAGALADLVLAGPGTMPAVVDAATGPGRRFSSGDATALIAQDVTPGDSLAVRDLTIMALVKWDIASQALSGGAASLVCRGKGGSAAEFAAYDLRLAVVDAPSRTGSIGLAWQDTSGVVHAQTPVEFTSPTGFTILTATRRWVSPTSVVCRYYIGDLLLGEVASSDGSIGGGASGTFVLGARAVAGVYGSYFEGIVDEIAIFDREMCLEEIEDVWLRITVYQPLGVQLFREMHDEGFPQSLDPRSDIQLEIRWVGNLLGFAASRAENVRRNILPQRAYGEALDDWEDVVRPTRQPGHSLDDRRARVLARMRQRLGSSVPGFRGMLAGLIGGADPAQLEFLSFSNTWVDDFAAGINSLRWDVRGATWLGGLAQLNVDANQHPWPSDPFYLRRATDGTARQAHQIVKLTFPTSQQNAEAGIYFGDHAHGNYFLFGMRDLGPALHFFTEAFTAGVAGGATDRGNSGHFSGDVFSVWLHLHQAETAWEVSWSLTSGTEGFTAPIVVAGAPPAMQWAGCYYRTVGAVAGSSTAKFDDHVLRLPYGTSPLNAYVLLDQALGFSPDIPGARQIVDTVKHAFVHGTFITQPQINCDDPDNGCDEAPLGGY